MGFPGGASGKEPTCHCRRLNRHGFNPCIRKMPWRRAWQPTSCLDNSMDGGGRWATVHRVPKSQTQLKRLSMCAPYLISLDFLSFLKHFSNHVSLYCSQRHWAKMEIPILMYI